VPVAVVFLLRAVVLVLLWGFVVAAVVAVRHDVFGTKPAKPAPSITPPRPAAQAPTPPPKPARGRGRKGAPTVARHVAVVEGPATGTSVALSSLPITIGRADDATISLADDYVSNHHARLVPSGQDWLIEDTGSTNGTFVGDKKVTTPVVVPVGSRIKIGRNVLELRA
jgi:pSer/pThr/pTyr-binding forkhead associated (FHA) protein